MNETAFLAFVVAPVACSMLFSAMLASGGVGAGEVVAAGQSDNPALPLVPPPPVPVVCCGAPRPDPTDSPNVISLLSREEIKTLGLIPPVSIVGVRSGDGKNKFLPDLGFLRLLHEVVGRVGPLDADLRQAASRRGEGRILVTDKRTPPDLTNDVPSEDIVGSFAVRAGRIVPESYQANPGYLAVTTHGLMQLPGGLGAALHQEVRTRAGLP